MSYATDKWFNYLREEVLTEGLRDIGLPEVIIDRIENNLPGASEKAKTWMGHQWKNTSLRTLAIRHDAPGSQEFGFNILNHLMDRFGAHVQDDSSKEEKEKAMFVIKNITQTTRDKPFGTWAKTFKKGLKNLSKLPGVKSEQVEASQEFLKAQLQSVYERFYRQYEEVFTLLNQDPTNYEYVKGGNIDEGLSKAQEYLDNQEDPDQVIHTFEDGSYWYDLQTSNCSVEGERMGHCGSDSRGTLISLRKKEARKKQSKSYVTLAYNDFENTIYQIKGWSNSAPPESVWEHISWFIENAGVEYVEENGEHSNDPDEFRYMIDHLKSENPSVNFNGSLEDRMNDIAEQLAIIEQEYSDLENCSVYSNVEEYDNEPYIDFGAECSFDVNLGWLGLDVDADGDFVPMTAHVDQEDREVNDKLHFIPASSWGERTRNFLNESGIDDILSELPGEDNEVEYDVAMLVGPAPANTDLDFEPAATAHLRVRMMLRGETSQDPDDFSYFAGEVRFQFEDKYKEIVAGIRTKLAAEGYAIKTPWDHERETLKNLEDELENWSTYQDDEGSEHEFWFFPIATEEGARAHSIEANVEFPPDIFYYAADREERTVFRQIFPNIQGTTRHNLSFEGDDLNKQMAQQLTAQYAQKHRAAAQQGEFDFGAAYKAIPPVLELARDMRFIIQPRAHYYRDGGGLSGVTVSYKLTIGVDPNDTAEDIERTVNFVKYLNDNPDEVKEAANELISYAVEAAAEEAAKNKRRIQDGSSATTLIAVINRRYSQQAEEGNTDAEAGMLVASWIEASWDQMGAVERSVAERKYLYPMSQGSLALRYLNPQIGDQSRLGQPSSWVADVKEELRYRGATGMIVRDYAGVSNTKPATFEPKAEVHTTTPLRGTVGEPVSVGANWGAEAMRENINLPEELPPWIETSERYEENQLDRVEKLLEKLRDPAHDLRIYNIRVGCNLIDRVGGTDAEIAAQIRGIDGVTTVRPIAASKREITPTETFVVFDIKFELVGAQSRVEYRDLVLLPQMRQIAGVRLVDWSAIHKTNVQGTIRTVREMNLNESGFGSAFGLSNFGGLARNLGNVRDNATAPRPTPTPTLDHITQDWAEGGVQVYDVPTDANDMRYHTMLPTEELWTYRSRVHRYPMDIFDIKHQRFDSVYQRLKDQLNDPQAYQAFIKDGAQGPVYVAIGKNGRIKITGNEDLLWFAKKSGLEEVPVFLSYQRQV